MSGIAHDILLQAATNLGWKLNFVEEVGWGSMIESVNTKRVQIIGTGIWPTASRGKSADFTNPIFYSAVKAYVSASDIRFNGDYSKINNPKIRIAVVDGEMAAIIAKTDFPDAQQKSLTQISDISQLLLDVSTGKADVTFAEPAIALEFIAKNPGKIKELEGVKPIRIFPNSFLVAKDSNELVSTLNVAINELINTGVVDKIISKYEKYPNSFMRVSTPYELR